MSQEDFLQDRQIASEMSLKAVVGWVILVVGIVAAGWVFFNIVGLFAGDEQPAIVTKLSTLAGGQMLITTPGGNIGMPGEIATLTGYCLATLLLLVASYISVAFIKAGASLAGGDVNKQLRRLINRLRQTTAAGS